LFVLQTITAAGTRKNESVFGELQTQLKNKKLTVDVKANSESDLLTTVTVDEFGTPGLKSILSLVVPDQRSGKVFLGSPPFLFF
jgi:voltage-dependent anion channel protein 2